MQDHSLLFSVRQNLSASDDLRSAGRAPPQPSSASRTAAAPSILLTATLRWPIAARLAIAFDKLGARVEAACPHQHPVTKTRALRRSHPYSALMPLRSLRAAIASAQPDLIIPCDDNAALHLHQLYARAAGPDPAATALREVIARSLGKPEACPLATARGRFMALAAEEGVRIPETTVAATPSDLDAWLSRHPLPTVIKIDCTWGGQGVAIVRNHDEARRVFGFMASRPSMRNAMARLLLDRDPSPLLNSLRKSRRTVTLQDFITGSPANRAVACWQGQVLAGTSVEAIKTQHPTGPATVVRVIENREMSEAVNRLVRRLGLSGLWGIDFVLEASTGAAYMIEMNPRATPICHLPLGPGHDLPAALCAHLAGAPAVAPLAAIDPAVIALFPGEWQRNPASAHLRSDYHDIPWDEPGLVQECVERPWSERGLIARLWSRLRPKTFGMRVQQKDLLLAQISVEIARQRLTLKKVK